MGRIRLPSFAETIRFRLSLAFAVVVFAVGAAAIAGVFLYENSTLVEPVIMAEKKIVRDLATGELTEVSVIFPEESQRVMAEKVELDAYRRALNSLRTSSFLALGILFLAAFGSGWFLSGWALKPVRSMTAVAQGITGSDLGRRIGMTGPRDEMRDMGDTFDSMLDRLEVAFDDQRRFVAEASHELRNPLAVARTNLELALQGGDDEEIRTAAAIAYDAATRMSGMVDELLDQARESLPVNASETVDLGDLARSVVQDFRASARQRGLRLEVRADPVEVTGDRLALRRAAVNLVSNAIRLAPEHSTVTVSVAKAEDGRAQLAVEDVGPGLTPDQRTRVFDRFWQGEGQEGRGAGLGLAIVKRIAERHGGTAEVVPAGDGSRFVITI
ncbi:MAG: HAMP domain-containing histidine kinase [Acidimicrobiales bacterium]|nr:HAMP domain-containing histidine kinase [Acidimicrobiales bacterium]